jgi:selenoprotein W-related protein
VEDEIRMAYENADVIALPSFGGIFDVEVNGKVIFSKKETNRFPNPGEIVDLLKQAGY